MDQYWNTIWQYKVCTAICFFYHKAIASSKQKTFFSLFTKTVSELHFCLFSFSSILVTFNASTNKHWLWWHYSSLLMPNFVFCFLKTQCSKDDGKKKQKNQRLKKWNDKKKKHYWTKKERLMRSLHIFLFINNTIEITLPSPDDAIDT